MKWLKQLGVLLIFIIIVTVGLSLIMPTQQKVERTVTIALPASKIYEQLSRLENFNNIAVWNQHDSSVKHTVSGIDGSVGASDMWQGDPSISGEGIITITALEPNKKIAQTIRFKKPKKGTARSVFTLSESNGLTTVTWDFYMDTPRPWNIFNLFNSLDADMGPDFEAGLSALKTNLENKWNVAVAPTANIEKLNFPATTYAIVRQKVKWEDVQQFYDQHIALLMTEAAKKNISPGIPTGLVFEWDEKNRTADIAAAIAVSTEIKFENPVIELVSIPDSKAIYTDHYGESRITPDIYPLLKKDLTDNNLQQTFPIIEEFLVDVTKESDTSKWKTRIIFLVR